MRYIARQPRHRWHRRFTFVLIVGLTILVVATVFVQRVYNNDLQAVSSSQQTKTVAIGPGMTSDQIATVLQNDGLIRSSWAFKLYVSSKEVREDLEAGTYDFSPSQTIPEIVSQLTHGKIVTNLVTILPGQNIDQIEQRLIQSGFSQADVTAALNPATYAGNPALVDKPVGASLEGYIYPNSYQRTTDTSAQTIVSDALTQMAGQLTPGMRAAFAKQGLSTYQAIVLASIVEKEVSSQSDRNQVAQVFLSRLHGGIDLESDVTVQYGALLNGVTSNWQGYQSAYNTYDNAGLPPTPISNVSHSSLEAVAYPANTNWLYFVAGDDGTTHFATTLAQQQANVAQYCKQSCAQTP